MFSGLFFFFFPLALDNQPLCSSSGRNTSPTPRFIQLPVVHCTRPHGFSSCWVVSSLLSSRLASCVGENSRVWLLMLWGDTTSQKSPRSTELLPSSCPPTAFPESYVLGYFVHASTETRLHNSAFSSIVVFLSTLHLLQREIFFLSFHNSLLILLGISHCVPPISLPANPSISVP